MDDAVTPEDFRLANLVRAEARRAGTIVRNLLELVRPQEARVVAVDVKQVIEDTLQLRAYAHGLQIVTVRLDLAPLAPILGDHDRLRQVFLNLLMNAEQAVADQAIRRIEINGRMDGDAVEVTVADNGPGIAEQNLERIFEPFFTTKPVGQGTGLGLSVTHGIVRDLGGVLSVRNQRQGGASFTLRLPAAVAPEAPEPAPASVGAPVVDAGRAMGCVLLVDDEPAIREVGARSLQRAGFAVEVAGNGEAALELLQRRRFDVILSDIKMPGLGGEALYRRLEALRIPALDRFIFISGDIVADATSAFLAETGRPYVTKPFELKELVATVRRVADAQRAGA